MRSLVAALAAAAIAAGLAAGCGGSRAPGGGLRVADTAPRLEALLAANHVRPLAAHPGTLEQAWRAFRRFAALPVARDQLQPDPTSDQLLLEVGVFAGTFDVDLVRQFLMKDGDIQQLHLDAHFPAARFPPLRDSIHDSGCLLGGQRCPTRCFFVGLRDLVGSKCMLSTGRPNGWRALQSFLVWSDDAGGRDRWVAFLDSWPLFQRILAEAGEPLGYDVWRDSVEGR